MSKLTLLVLYPLGLAAWLTSILVLAMLVTADPRSIAIYGDVWGWLGESVPLYANDNAARLFVVWMSTAVFISVLINMVHAGNARMQVKRLVENAVYDIMKPYIGGLKDAVSMPAIAERLQQRVEETRSKNAAAAEVLDAIATTLFGKSKIADIPDLIGHARVLQKKAEKIEATIDVDSLRVIELSEAVMAVEQTIRTIESNIDDAFSAAGELEGLEARIEQLTTRMPEAKMTELLGAVKALRERVTAYSTLVTTVLHDPLRDGNDLDDTLRTAERSIEEFENADIEDYLGRLADLEMRLGTQTERFKDHEGVIARVRESFNTTERLKKTLERVTLNPLGTDKPDLHDTLRDLESDLDRLEGADLEDAIGTLAGIEARLGALNTALARQTSSLHAVA